jgi:hypothetical protein
LRCLWGQGDKTKLIALGVCVCFLPFSFYFLLFLALSSVVSFYSGKTIKHVFIVLGSIFFYFFLFSALFLSFFSQTFHFSQVLEEKVSDDEQKYSEREAERKSVKFRNHRRKFLFLNFHLTLPFSSRALGVSPFNFPL